MNMKKRTLSALVTLASFAAGIILRKMRQSPVNLSGQSVLITGGSRGLGFLLAREFAREGCRVAICARNLTELERARRTLAKETGAAVLAVRCDVAEQAEVQHLVDEVTRRFGRVDILVNNAGVLQAGPLENLTVQDFEVALGVMFWGILYPTLAVLPQMRRRGRGRIVNVTSIGGKVSLPHLLPYGSAKFAAVGLSEGLRAELRNKGIIVTTVAPGLMRTGSYVNALFTGRQSKEFTWFSLGSSLPILSMDAERAARQIVRAARRGEAERVLSIPASLLSTVHGVLPGVTQDILGLVGMLLLPRAEGGSADKILGRQARMQVPSRRRRVLDALTVLRRQAAHRFQ